MNLTPFIYADHIEPNGSFPATHAVECSAAFHFAKLAIRILAKVPEQITLEGRDDKTVDLRAVAESVVKLYSLEDLGTLMSFLPAVRKEAFCSGLPWDDRLQAWIDSGGRSYNLVTREEGRVNIQ
jgi:hypothetical protein